MSWNIQDHKDDKTNKFEIKNFTTLFTNIKIICLQETKGPIKLPDYMAYNSNRSGSRSGGVAVLVHNSIRKGAKPVKTDETEDIVAIKLDKHFFKFKSDIYLINFYVSPALSSYTKRHAEYAEKLFENLEQIVFRLQKMGRIVLCGDANARTGCLPDFIMDTKQYNDDSYTDAGIEPDIITLRNNSDLTTNSYCDLFIDSITNNQLRIVNGRTLGDCLGHLTCHKHNGSSTVDYFVTSRDLISQINSLQVLDLNAYSDHCPLILMLSFETPFQCISPTFNFGKMPLKYKWNNMSTEGFVDAQNTPACINKLTEMLAKEYTPDAAGSEQFTNDFTEIVHHTATNSLSRARPPKDLPHKKWFDTECAKSKQNLNRLARNISRHPHIMAENKKVYFDERKKHNKLIWHKKNDFLSRLNKSIENGHVLDWKKFKQLKQSNDTKVCLDKYDLLSFYEYFSELYKKSNNNPNLTEHAESYTQTYKGATSDVAYDLNVTITSSEMENAIKKLHLGKSTNEDLISNEMLKNLSDLSKTAMLKLFNHCISNGQYPWHTSVITPIYKSGNAYNPDNYRAIAVGSCLGKLFSSILLFRLTEFKKKHCKDPKEQLGFQKGAQTNDHVLTLKTIIDKYTKKQKTNLLACFVDLRKAFDTVARDLLLYKLVKLGIRGNFFSVIENMYNNSLSKIKINNLLSGNIRMERGTEQGHPLSPDLFKLFIRDLSELFFTTGDYPFLKDTLVNHLLWADDLVLLALDSESLQNNINVLYEFCKAWGLSINITKTKVVCFYHGRIKNATRDNFYLDSDIIEYTESYCYLGIVFHQNGSFKIAQNQLRKKALRALFGLKRNILKNTLSIVALFKLFDSLVKPVLLYGCQVIFPHCLTAEYLNKPTCYTDTGETFLTKVARDPFEKFYIKFLKWCLSVHSKASNIGCWGDTGRYPLFTDITKLCCDYFVRVKKCEPGSLLHDAFWEQQSLNLKWYNNMNETIEKVGTSSPQMPSKCRLNQQVLFVNKWQEAKQASTKLDFYKSIKHNFGFEKYLLIANNKHRSALTKMRISAHNLYIEKGRYTDPITPREDRFCLYCRATSKQWLVESETHAIETCKLYDCARASISCDLGNTTFAPLTLFENPSKNPAFDELAGKLSHTILEINKTFTEYYTDSQFPHNSTGNCVIL